MFSTNILATSRYTLRQFYGKFNRLAFGTSSSKMDKYITKEPRKTSKTESTEKNGEKKPLTSPQKITRGVVKNAVETDKEKYLKMPLEEKRGIYKCKNKYKTLDNVPTWQDMYLENKAVLLKKVSKKGASWSPKKTVNEDLNQKISIWRGDITTLEIDAIVNAANNSLLGGGGVDGAIHSAAGSKLVAECATLKGCDTGDAKITGGYKLPAKYVIHTVGPIGVKPKLLESAYLTCLKLAKENKLRSLAFPCISTGIYGYSNEKAAPLVLNTIREWLDKDGNAKLIDRIIFCLFMQVDIDLYEELMQVYFPVELHPKENKASNDDDVPDEKNNSPESMKTSNTKNVKKASDTEMKNVSKINIKSPNKTAELENENMVVEENKSMKSKKENNSTGVENSSIADVESMSGPDAEMVTENLNKPNADQVVSKTQTESASESVPMDIEGPEHQVTKNKDSLKLSTPLTRSKRQKEKSLKDNLTPTELGPPPKFKNTAMETP